MARGLTSERNRRLVAVGVAAGVFSGLFGVGGGSVIIPFLILALGYDERLAMGTSLAAIALMAAVGAATQAAYGNVHVVKGLVLGVPAIAGALAGTWLQQRLGRRVITLLFCGLLVAVALDILVQ